MGRHSGGGTYPIYLGLLVISATLVMAIYDRPYVGSPKAPWNLLRPSPGKQKLTGRPLASNSLPKNLPEAPESEYRLPTALRPVHYVVRLQPFISGNFSTKGHVEIEMEVLEPTSNVTLNLYSIDTYEQTIKVEPSGGGTGIGIVSTSFDAIRQFFIVSLAEELQPGQNYVISLDFEGFLDNTGFGFYRGSYVDDDGTTVFMAISYFASGGARYAFPCFDEPSLKATFDITLGREDTMTTLSNTPIIRTTPIENQPGWSWDTYETTVVMSTYLLAFFISDFASNTTTTSTGLPYGVWARQQKITTTQYALDKGPDVLEFFEGYMQLPYVMPKMDMVATTDFGGAMENWGLIIYAEYAMLYDPAVDSLSDLQYVMRVIAHETAHQWFGNIVTAAWWSHIWLNEGFASYMEYIGADFCEPTWNIIDTLLTDDQHYIFERDSLASYSHPVINPAESPDEINSVFDSIPYSKGASLNRMQKNILTEATFVSGLISYLSTFQYQNVYQDDLFEHLTTVGHADGTLPSDMTIKQIMDTWTLQAGYPLITVTRSADGTTATVSQKRFWTDNPDTPETWWVPITYTTQVSPDFENTQPVMWMSDADLEITVLPLPSQNEWVIFNIQETGYYRVNYDDNNWNLLFAQLDSNPDAIHPLNRAQIYDDYYDIARAGLLSYSNALQLSTYLRKETEYIPWVSALNNLDYIETMLRRTDGHDSFKNYLLDLLLPLYDEMGFHAKEGNQPQKQLKHMLVVAWVCDLGHEDCVKHSVDLYNRWMNTPENKRIIHPNLKKTVYCTAIAEGGVEEWNFAWTQYLQADAVSEKHRLLEAMACSRDSGILYRYLESAFTKDSGIKKDDAMMVFSSVAKSSVGRDVAWNFLQHNGHSAAKYLHPTDSLDEMVRLVAEMFNTEDEKTQLEEFQSDFSKELSSPNIDVVPSAISFNISWMNRNYNDIMKWLKEHGY